MRNSLSIAFVILVLVTAFEGKAQDIQTRKIDDFTSFSVMGKIRVELYPSTKDSLVVIAEGTTTGDIITEVDEGQLNIRLNTNIPKDAKITARLYFNDLEKIFAASNALILSPDTLKADNMSFESKSGAKIELRLVMNSIIAEAKQGGILVFYGSVNKQEIGVSSGGTYSAFQLIASEAFIKATTGGRAKVSVTEKIDATANTTGYVAYKGDPAKEKLKTNLGGEVVKMEDF